MGVSELDQISSYNGPSEMCITGGEWPEGRPYMMRFSDNVMRVLEHDVRLREALLDALKRQSIIDLSTISTIDKIVSIVGGSDVLGKIWYKVYYSNRTFDKKSGDFEKGEAVVCVDRVD